MDQEDSIDAAHAAAASEPSQMPLPPEATESAQPIDVVHAAATAEPTQIPSPSEAAATAHDDSSTLLSSSDSLASSTENLETEPRPDPGPSILDRVRHAIGLPKREEDFSYGVPEIIPSLDSHPRGYPKVAAYQNIEPAWLIFRKFGWLRNHALLDLQDEIKALEEDLKEHNRYEYQRGDRNRLLSRSSDYERPNSREPLMIQIKEKLEQYDKLLLRTQKVQAIKGPSRRYQNSLYTCIHLEQNIMRSGTEEHWIRRSDDLASIAGDADNGWLSAVVEDSIRDVSKTILLKFFRTKQQRIQTGSVKGLYLVDFRRVDMLSRAIVTITASGLLLMPVVILFKLQPTTQAETKRSRDMQLLVILAFTVLFSASCSIFTRARKQEVFSATAAYAAVLVIFLGSASGNNSLPA